MQKIYQTTRTFIKKTYKSLAISDKISKFAAETCILLMGEVCDVFNKRTTKTSEKHCDMGLIYFLLATLALGIASFIWTANYYHNIDV